jgi:GAF domain-containing protein
MSESQNTPEERIKALELENARLRETNETLQRETDSLRLVTAGLISSFEPSRVLNDILVSLESVIPYDSACIFLMEGSRQRAVAGRGFPLDEQIVGQVFTTNDPITRELWQHRQPIVIEDAQTWPDFEPWGSIDYIRGWMAVPMFVRSKAIGYLTLDSRQPGTYGQEEAQIAQAFANQAAAAIEMARLFETEHRQRARAETLQQAGSLITSSLDLDEVLHNIARQVARSMAVPACSIMLLEPPNMLVRRVYLDQPNDADRWPSFQRGQVGQGLSGWVAANRKPLSVYDMAADERTTSPVEVREQGLCSFLGVPMEVRRDLIGVLNIYTTQPRQFLDEEVELLAAFAGQVAVAVENARLFEQVQQQAELLEARIMTRTAELVSANEQLRQEIAERQRVEEELHAFTKRLERRAVQLQAAAAVARDVTAARDLDELLSQAVKLVKERFGFYHAGIFMVDSRGEYAVLRSATGDFGRQMLAQKHRLKIGDPGIVSYVVATNQARVTPNVAADAYHLKNPLLAETQSEMALPLGIGDVVIGALDVQSKEPDAFDDDTVATLQIMADLLSVAIDNARLLQKEKRQMLELTILHAVAVAGTEAKTADDLFEQVTSTIGETLFPDTFGVLLVDEPAGLLRLHPSYRRRQPWLQKSAISLESGITGLVVREGRPLRVPDVRQEPAYLTGDPATVSELCVPIRVGQRIIGVINAESSRPATFSAADEQLLLTIAGQLSTALERLHLFEVERRRATRQRIVAEAAGAMLATLNVDQLWPLVAEAACRALGADRFAAYIYDPAQNQLSCSFARGLSEQYVAELNRRFQEAPGTQAIRHQRFMVIRNVETDPSVAPLRELMQAEGFRSYVVFPLQAPEVALGALVVYYDSLTSPTPDALTAGQTLAHITSVAVQNSILYNRLATRAEELSLALSGSPPELPHAPFHTSHG